MYKITIYTPTFNRDHVLWRVYDSLCRQTYKDFYWMIIDDGSTDNTHQLVHNWIKEDVLKIEYIYKKNGGVHTARDLAYTKVNTELIMGVDSDDWLKDDAIENIIEYWENYGGIKYAGIFTPIVSPQNNRIGSFFPNIKEASYQDFTYKFKYKGDKQTILRSDIIKSIPNSPVFKGESLVPEGCKWIQLPDDKPFLLLDKPTLIVDYQDDGFSKNARKNIFRNPYGFRFNSKQHIIHSKYFIAKFKGHLKYILYSLYLKDKKIIKNSPKPLPTLLLLPFGIACYIYIRLKWPKKLNLKK